MVDKKSLDFLPQTFRTATNRRFLNATIDQLIQEPNMSRIYGYIGRQNLSPSYVEGDAYVQELDSYSQYYQLEPGLVINKRIVGTDSFRKENAYNYVDLLNSISLAGGINTDHSRLFANEYYNYEGFVDLDKLVNYGKYYWMPNGPNTIDVNSGGLETNKDFLISRPLGTDVISKALINTNIGKVGYSVDAFPGKINPTITLVRGGTYNFNVSQFGHPFWIQTEPGIDPGTTFQKNILRREVFGVSGNGTEVGNISFAVPSKSAQYIFEQMPIFDTVDIVTDLPFNLIQNATYDEFVLKNNLDGLKSFESKKIILTNDSDDFWYEPDIFGGSKAKTPVTVYTDGTPADSSTEGPVNSISLDFAQETFDRGIPVPKEKRNGIWQLTIVDGKIRLSHIKDWPASTKIFVNEGRQYGHTYVFKDTQLKIYSVPNLTAPLDVLYYQDGVDPNVYGEIRIVDNPPLAMIDINSIIGKPDYISPNKVNFTNGLKVRFTGLIEPVEYTNKEYVVEGVGKSITLTAWENLVTPDPNNPNLGDGYGASGETFDELNYDFSLNAPLRKDYIVINRASVDGNGWSRTNRWFHEDVIKYSQTFNNPLANVLLDNNFRAIRPIVEFDSNLQLWNYGNKFVGPVTVIDNYITDVANQVEGRSPYVLVYPNKGKAVTKKLYQNAKVNTKDLSFDFVNDLSVDMRVIGSNIQSNTVIDAIDYNFKIVTLSKPLINDVNANTDITFNGDYVSDSVPLEDGTQVIFVREKYANVRNKIYSVKNIKPNSGLPQSKIVTAYSPRGSTRIKVISTENLYVNMKITGPTSVSEQGVTTYTIPNNTVIMTIDNDTDTITINNPLEKDLGSGNSISFSNDSPQIHLTPIHDLSQGETVVAVSGAVRQNAVYWWNNNSWQAAQSKFSLNQTPLFDVFNLEGISWGDKNYYASSTFAGSKLFGYKEGTGTRDYELGFALTYKSIGNIGDIVFENYYDTDTFNFNYNDKDRVVEISKGYVHEIDPTTLSYKLRNNWVAVQDLSKQFIEKKFVATENRLNNFSIDVAFKNSFNEKNLFVYVNGKEINRSNFFLYPNGVNSELFFYKPITRKTNKIAPQIVEIKTNTITKIFNIYTKTTTNNKVLTFDSIQSNIHAGMTVTGTNIPANTVINSIDSKLKTITLSKSILNDIVADTRIILTTSVTDNKVLSFSSMPANISVGTIVMSPVIQTNTVINSIDYKLRTITLSKTINDVVANDEIILFTDNKTLPFSSVADLTVGIQVMGSLIQTNTVIDSIDYDLKTVTLSNSLLDNVYADTEIIFMAADNLQVDDVLVIKIAGTPVGIKENYTLPPNLVDNSENNTFSTLTLGQIRNHLNEMTSNSLEYQILDTGNSNLRDINYKVIPGKILQHSAGVHVAQLMFNNETTNIVKAIDFNRRAYNRFKDRFFYLLSTMEFADTSNARACLEDILEETTLYSSNDQSFYYTDMIPFGKNRYILNEYPVYDTNYRKFNLIDTYNINEPSYQSVLVYQNNNQLIINTDYTVDGYVVQLTASLNLNINDIISIYEYSDTRGSMIPATPTKLGLYPKFTPEKYSDITYIGNPTNVIQGHDGSKTIAFDDYRDDILLEFENRIYNNINVTYVNDARTSFTGIEPGAFRETDYNLDEWTQLLSGTFLSWAGTNNVNIFINDTLQNDPFSFNYGQGVDKIHNEGLPGYWRAIYKYFYDTDRPHTHPWEMVGFSEKPDWWEVRYGPAPYTSGNQVLWGDMELGIVYQHGTDSYIDPRYARPELSKIIPVTVHGDLLSPASVIVTKWNQQTAGATWRFGDQSPQETAWRRSSDYPFAIQIAWALARPAQYCSLSLNRRDLIRIDSLNQIINKTTSNRKLVLSVTDDTQYVPGSNIWIRDRLVDLNLDIDDNFISIFNYYTLNLIYKSSAFTDKSYFQIIADQSSPNSTNTGIVIPQENYNLVVTKSAPVGIATYSAVIVEKSATGFTVRGFDNNKPYFTIIPRVYSNNNYPVKVSNSSALIYEDDAAVIDVIPYGTQLSTRQQVVDFLISYGKYLTSLGFQFIDTTSTDTIPTVANWNLAVKEFLFWIEQGWDINTVISLTPAGTKINFDSTFGIVDEITNSFNGNRILDNDGKTLQNKDYTTYRSDTAFELILKDTNKGIHLVDLVIVQYEHTIVFDNTTVFNDVIYEPSLGNRQYRMKISGFKTRDWNGSLYAPGFMINHVPIEEWQSIHDYYKGDIVKHKNLFYTARQFIPGSTKFNTSSWYEISGTMLNKQLVPNLAFNAQQFEHFYDVNKFDVNRYADSMARNSTGFVPRNYMSSMGLDNISQHKFYLGMIKEKGTQAAINAFLRAKMPYVNNDIQIDEQWAIRLGTYGGISQKDDIEVSLANAKTLNGSYLVEFLDSADSRNANWNTFKPVDLLIKPAVYDKSLFTQTEKYPKIVPTSGHVLPSEVNVSVFDMKKIYNINSLVRSMGEGSRIWVASDKSNDWNVYRITADIKLTVTGSTIVNDQVEFKTQVPHGLRVNDFVMLRNATLKNQGKDISGFYQVLSVSNDTFRVPAYPNVTTATGSLNGELYKLKSVRFKSRAEFAVSTPSKGWKLYDQAWIDGINGEWQVMVNKPIYSAKQSLTPVFALQADNFGSAIDVKPTQDIMVVGAENKTSAGSVYVYRYGGDGTWGVIDSVTPKDSYAEKFGNCLQYNDLDCAVVGAPESISSTGLAYIMKTTSSQVAISQALYLSTLNTGDEFGRSVTTSQDGIWVAVGSPGANKVHVWKYVEVEPEIRTISLGGSLTHEMPATAIDANADAGDVQVKLNGNLLVPYLDYTTDGRDVTLTSLPAWSAYTDYVNGSLVTNTVLDVTTVYTITKSFTSGATFQTNIGTTHTGTVTSNNGFDIFVTITTDTQPEVGGKLTSGALVRTITQVTNNLTSYTLRLNSAISIAQSSSITFKDRDALNSSDAILTISYESYYKYITGFTNSEVDGRFGESVNFNGDGSQLAIGAPELDITVNNNTYSRMGSAYIFERTIETFVADGTSKSFDLEFKDRTTFDLYNDRYVDSLATYGTIYVNDPTSGLSNSLTTLDIHTVTLPYEVYSSDWVLDPLSPLRSSTTLFPEFSAILPVVYVNGTETMDYSLNSYPDVAPRILTLNSIPSKDSLVTVETNNFQLLTKVKSPRSQNYLRFGKKVVLCPTTCSLYVGATGYNNTSRNNGAVFRFINLARLYGGIVAQKPNPTFKVGSGIRLNGVKVTFTGTTLNAAVADINNANIPGVKATVLNNQYLRLTSDSKIAYSKLILNTLALATPYDATVYEDILLSVFAYSQLIVNPADSDSAAFGKQISLDRTATKLLVSSDTATNKIPMTFDVGKTSFDRNTTLIQSVYYRSGAAYLFEYQGDVGEDSTTHGNFTLAQKFAEPTMASNDKYGTAIAITSNWVMITANSTRKQTGTVYTYSNATGQKNWQVLREKPKTTDSRKIDKIFLYNDNTKTLTATLPVLDPEHGIPVPSAAEQIRYIVNYDPAVYTNVPNSFTFSKDNKNAWGKEHVGQLWWDTNNIKYADWNQGTLLDKFSNWGLTFPNSYVNVYEWIESDMSPSQYGKTYPMSGPLYTASDVYTTKSVIDPHSLQSSTKYYFWVKNSNSNSNSVRRDSALSLQNLIAAPRNINIPFAAVISDNAIALFNCQDIVNNDTRLHITVKKVLDNNDIHEEWSMFDDGTDLGIAQEFLDRLNDSLSGEDARGKTVPDQNLTEKQKYGLGIRPRQTTFSDKFSARKIWIDNVNSVLIQHPVALLRDLNSLYGYDPEPIVDTTTIKFAVDFDSEIEYFNKAFYTLGDKALIKNDSTTGGWTVRQLSVDPANTKELTWAIVQVQTYDIRNYWVYTDWYAKQFSASTPIRKILDYDYQISSTDIEVGDVIKINNGGDGNWKLILVNSDSLELVGQQNATIQFSSNLYDNTGAGFGIDNTSFEITPYAKDCSTEFRKIFDIVNKSILNESLRTDFKKVVKVMIDTIATQFKQSDWLFKTSLINIKNRVRGLDQIPVYVKETDNIVTEFINEIKPYHTKIKGYTSSYDKIDMTELDVVDFDLPPYYNTEIAKYREPQFNQYPGNFTTSPLDDLVVGNNVYKSWLENHTYGVDLIDIKDGGTGYTSDVVVNIIGDGFGATAEAYVRNGAIFDVVVSNPGKGYTYAIITLNGLGSGAKLYAKLGNATARTIHTTMDFARFTYDTQTKDWKAKTYFTLNDVILHKNIVYRLAIANQADTVTESTVLKINDFSIVNSGSNYRTGDILTVDGGSTQYVTELINGKPKVRYPAPFEAAQFKVVNIKVGSVEIDPDNLGTDYVVGSRLVFNRDMSNSVILNITSVSPVDGHITGVEIISSGVRTLAPEIVPVSYDILDQGSVATNTLASGTTGDNTLTTSGTQVGTFVVGQKIVGNGYFIAGIPDNTYITDISGTSPNFTLTLSENLTADVTNKAIYSYVGSGAGAKFAFTWTINSLELVNAGTYTVLPSNTATTTSNSQFGTGATVTLVNEVKGIITGDKFDENYLVEYQVRKWEPYTAYNKDTIVVYNNVPYVALTNFVSDRYFEFNSNITTTNSDDWQSNSNYKVGTIINYGGIAYRVVDNYFDISQPNPDPETGDNHKTPVVFNENHLGTIFPLTVYNGGYFDDSASKVWSYYRPSAGMAGRDLEQVMTGITYPGVNVTGPNFNQAPGFDFGIYEQITYDTRTYDENGLVDIYGDQSLDSNYFSLYKDTQLGLRPEDILTDGAAYIDENSSHAPEELVPGHIFDTLDIRVKTLVDITVSGSPELVVVGVYADDILTRFSYDPAITNTPLPISRIEHIFVLDDITGLQVENVDYVVNYEKMYIQFNDAPQIPATIFITIVGNSGENIVSDSQFIGNGVQREFIIDDFTLNTVKQAYVKVNNQLVNNWSLLRSSNAINWLPNQQYSKDNYISYNNITYRVLEDFTATETFDFSKVQSANNIVIRFDSAPSNGAVIQIHLFNIPDTLPNKDTFKSYSHVNLQTHIVPTGFVAGTTDYEIPLDQTIEYVKPFEAMVYVRINGAIIEPSSQAYYVANGIIDNYSLPSNRTVDDVTKISDSDIIVVVDRVTKVNNFDYTINRNGVDLPTITFSSIPKAGSKITISNRRMSQYAIYNENVLNIKSSYGLTAGDKIEIISYSNHDNYDISVEVFDGTQTVSTSVALGFENNGFDLSGLENEQSNVLLQPFYNLSRPVYNINNFRLSLNGGILIPYYDFTLVTPTILRIDPAYGVTANDVIVVQHISEKTRQENIEYRIFKGITETYDYLGISSGTTTKLSRDLLIDDKWIYVEDINPLSQPDPNRSSPGVVFIGSERITFYVVDFVNKRLGQLRRATNGTGAPTKHLAGIRVDDGGAKVEIPNSRDSYYVPFPSVIWRTETQYKKGDIVKHQNIVYRVKSDYTSEVEFTEKDLTDYLEVYNPTMTLIGKTGGKQTIGNGSLIRQGKTWLTPGLGSAADGLGILVADTVQANFLRSL